MKKNRGLTTLCLAITLTGSLTLAGCDNTTTQQAAPPTQVEVVTLKATTVNVTTELPGRTNPYRIAEVRPQVSGIILKRNFIEGSEITVGESLYQIDPAPYQAAYDLAKGALAKAQAAAEISALTVKRYKTLLGTKYISQQEYDMAVASARQDSASVVSAKATLEQARIDLVHTKVISPISGRIGISSVTEGALVTTGQANPLSSVQRLDPIYVDVTQSSNDFLRLRKELETGVLTQADGKASISLKLADGSLYPQKGTLEFSDVTVDESTGSITLRAIFPNPDKLLLPGMFVRAILDEGVKSDAILVPQRGVTRNPRGEATVLLVNSKGLVEGRIITVSQTIGDQWLVTGGLQPGERVIITGMMKVRENMPVAATEYKSATPDAKPQGITAPSTSAK